VFVLSWEKRVSSEEFEEDTAKWPHVNGNSVIDAEDYLGRTVESGLNVCVDTLVQQAGTAKVNDFNTWFIFLSQKDVLWL